MSNLDLTTIADAYEENERIRKDLCAIAGTVAADEADARPDGEKWSVREIVEHIAMVDAGTARICEKLVREAKAAGRPGDGQVNFSESFREKSREADGVKVEAPERVQPTGNASIEESLERIEMAKQAFEALRPDLESYDPVDHRFPHPFYGQINAVEWLVAAGSHEARHAKQIETLLGKIRG